MPPNNEIFEYHSSLRLTEVIQARLLIASYPEFSGTMVSISSPVEESFNDDVVPVVIRIPRSSCLPDFWRKLCGALNPDNHNHAADTSDREAVVQFAFNIAGSHREREKVLARVVELKTTSPDWQ